jgi:hypothetical protein
MPQIGSSGESERNNQHSNFRIRTITLICGMLGRASRGDGTRSDYKKNPPSAQEQTVDKKLRVLAPVAITATTSAATATATAATTTSAATVTAAAATTTGGTVFTRTRFIDGQRATLKILLLKHGNGFGRIFLRAHFDKRETTGTAGSTILHDIHCDD